MAFPKWQNINTTEGMLVRIINGVRALCTQTFDEYHKKQGQVWSASRLIIDAPTSTGVINSAGVYYSIVKTGSLPIILSRREFARTGSSMISDIFENPSYTGGTLDPVYNVNGNVVQSFEFELLVGFTLTDEGTKFAPTVYDIGPDSQQAKGSSSAPLGEDYYLAPDTSYLLKFYSVDPQLQDISARISGYEGPLDFPTSDL